MGARCYITLFLLIAVTGCAIPEQPFSPPQGAPVRFSDRDRGLILEFYSQFEFPPAIADPSVISPDIEERLETTAEVPPGTAGTPLPVSLEENLSPLPPGYVRFRAGSSVILMDRRTREIIDLVEVPFR